MAEPRAHGRILAPRDYQPAWWLPDGHSQTLWGALARRPQLPAWSRERFELPDGDFVDLAHVGPPDAPSVLILHGLEGELRSPPIAALLAAVAARGWHGVLMHFRGCSGETNRLARTYHAGDTADVAAVAAALRARHPRLPLAVVGYSLGGNVLLKYLGEKGHAAGVTGAVAISVPFDLAGAARRLAQGFSKIYQRRLLTSLQLKARQKARHIPSPIDLTDLHRWNDFETFDNRLIAPLHGFADAADYYTRSSARQFLRGITVPTLLIHAVDDPFMSPAAIPSAPELAPAVTLELAQRGGHVGFIMGRVPGRAVPWLENRIVVHLAECFRASHQRGPNG